VQIEALVVERWNPVIEWPKNNPSGRIFRERKVMVKVLVNEIG